jgi:hypothetical protein
MTLMYSVVIPTLGGASLIETLFRLNSFNPAPAEILVCVPTDKRFFLPKSAGSNIKVITTAVRGQVAQRAIGFQQAANQFVLQLDDDMELSDLCIASLIQSMSRIHCKAAISPLLVNKNTNESVYKKIHHNPIISRFYYWLLNGQAGYQPGSVLHSGIPLGLDEHSVTGKLVEVAWLPGGCVLHRKENLLIDNFFPYLGKAYCEDIIHSHLLRKNGISLFVDTSARCGIELPDKLKIDFVDFFQGFKDDVRARIYYMRLIRRQSLRMWIYYVIEFAGFVVNRLKSTIIVVSRK